MRVWCWNKEPDETAPAEAQRLSYLTLGMVYTVAVDVGPVCPCLHKETGRTYRWFGLVEIPGRSRGGICGWCNTRWPDYQYLLYQHWRFKEALPDSEVASESGLPIILPVKEKA